MALRGLGLFDYAARTHRPATDLLCLGLFRIRLDRQDLPIAAGSTHIVSTEVRQLLPRGFSIRMLRPAATQRIHSHDSVVLRGRKLADILTDEVVPDAGGEDRGEGLGDVDRAFGRDRLDTRGAAHVCADEVGPLEDRIAAPERPARARQAEAPCSGNPQLAGSNEAISS